MCNVRDFTFAMPMTADGDVEFRIRYVENGSREEFTFEGAKSWLEDVKKSDKTITELIQEFDDVWWGGFFGSGGSARNYWNDKGYSVDYDSLERAGRDLMCVLRALAEGTRPFEVVKKVPEGWDVIEPYNKD